MINKLTLNPEPGPLGGSKIIEPLAPCTTIGPFLGTLKGIHFLDPPRGLGTLYPKP